MSEPRSKKAGTGRRPASTLCGGTVAGLAMVLVAGCAVGPNFKKPPAPDVTAYTERPIATTVATPGVDGGEAQHFANGMDISAEWWELFHSKALDDLIQEALKNNHDLKAAEAALAAAHEAVLAQRGAFYPSVSAGISATRQLQSTILAPVPNYPVVANEFQYNLFTPEVSVSYVPDVFGLNRRTVESLVAQEEGVRYQKIAVYTTLTANVVVTAIQLGAVEMQIDVTRQLIDTDQHVVDILRYQFEKGYASGIDRAAQESQLAQITATLPPLVKQAEQLRHELAVLAGRYPNEPPQNSFELSNLQLPQDLPVSLPSVLVGQRPDVLQAQENMHAASAEIGVAVANRLPNIALTADAGTSALAIGNLFTSGTGFWGLGAALSAPVFEGGMLLHQERAARDAYVQAAEQYRSTVLIAFQNVADTLAALEQDAEGLKAAAAAASAAKTTLDLAQRQVEDGYSGQLALLNAEQTYQQAQINLVQAQASRFADTAALFQALGGGWWHQSDLAEDEYEQKPP
jgi:NodT family efflux transporter outer membrane factor (OMF) lipoprotein